MNSVTVAYSTGTSFCNSLATNAITVSTSSVSSVVVCVCVSGGNEFNRRLRSLFRKGTCRPSQWCAACVRELCTLWCHCITIAVQAINSLDVPITVATADPLWVKGAAPPPPTTHTHTHTHTYHHPPIACVIRTGPAGTTEDVVCSNRGTCDYNTGQCMCFLQCVGRPHPHPSPPLTRARVFVLCACVRYGASDGQGGQGQVGDCGCVRVAAAWRRCVFTRHLAGTCCPSSHSRPRRRQSTACGASGWLGCWTSRLGGSPTASAGGRASAGGWTAAGGGTCPGASVTGWTRGSGRTCRAAAACVS